MAEPWTDVVQQRSVEVEVRCLHARRVLANAAAYLAPPMLVAEARAARGRIQVVLAILTSASDDLNRASNAATAAKLLALRGAAPDPTNPLLSIEQIPGRYRDARLALGLLQSARDCAVAACNSGETCRGHLHTAFDLLDVSINLKTGLPGVDDSLEVQRSLTTVHLEDALASSLASAALAVVANWLVR